MELIKISNTKLKIMLTKLDVDKYELGGVCGGLYDRASFRNILTDVRDKCGFDALGERVFVQYYPDKTGGCELFVTKLTGGADGSTGERRGNTTGVKKVCGAVETYDSGYIVYSFDRLDYVMRTCRSLVGAGYSDSSLVYRVNGRERYYLVLSGETYFAAENNGVRCDSSYYYVLLEHGALVCNDAVNILGRL